MKAKEKECCDLFTDGQYNLYVEKKYDGVAGITITSSSVSSTNESYNRQLLNAKVGDPDNPFPSIWHAQEKAKELVGNGIVANIIVRTNTFYTIGSPVLTQNGNRYGNNAINEEPDVKMANDVEVFKYGSLAQRDINYFFEKNSGIISISKTYAVPIIYIDKRISTDTTISPNLWYDDLSIWETNIYGMGEFKGVYGQVEGFIPTIFFIEGVPGLNMTFEADLIAANMRNWLRITSFSDFHLKVDKLWTYSSTFNIGNYYQWQTGGVLPRPKLNMDIREYRRGAGLFNVGLGASAVDYWSGANLFGEEGIDVTINIQNLICAEYTSVTGHCLFTFVSGYVGSNGNTNPFSVMKNTNVVINIDNLKQYMINVANAPAGGLFSFSGYNAYALGQAAVNTNNHMVININNAETNVPFNESYTMSGLLNSSFTVNVNNVAVSTSTTRALITAYIRGNATTIATNDLACINNQVVYRGRFVSNSAKGVFDTGLYSNTLANISPNFMGLRLENCTLIQRNATAPTVGLSWLTGMTF